MLTVHRGIRELLRVAPVGKNKKLTTTLVVIFGTPEVLEVTIGETHLVGTPEVLAAVGQARLATLIIVIMMTVGTIPTGDIIPKISARPIASIKGSGRITVITKV